MSGVNVGTIGVCDSRKITGLYAPHLVTALSDVTTESDHKLYVLKKEARKQMRQCISDMESTINILEHDITVLDTVESKKVRLRSIQEITIKMNFIEQLCVELDSPSTVVVMNAISNFNSSTGRKVSV